MLINILQSSIFHFPQTYYQFSSNIQIRSILIINYSTSSLLSGFIYQNYITKLLSPFNQFIILFKIFSIFQYKQSSYQKWFELSGNQQSCSIHIYIRPGILIGVFLYNYYSTFECNLKFSFIFLHKIQRNGQKNNFRKSIKVWKIQVKCYPFSILKNSNKSPFDQKQQLFINSYESFLINQIISLTTTSNPLQICSINIHINHISTSTYQNSLNLKFLTKSESNLQFSNYLYFIRFVDNILSKTSSDYIIQSGIHLQIIFIIFYLKIYSILNLPSFSSSQQKFMSESPKVFNNFISEYSSMSSIRNFQQFSNDLYIIDYPLPI
ncbi:unnamed protein product (macronuclear) [Paramecium tetraurelia]|uniref:Transmembrane protein n=1 Tax=Paramecium tetraurelia TaxID=5888 RepID=A0D245_PARTE|nr:uncharacterized protein GSPATT00012618001 [Paramecium tetraurelia]CAK77112.1 unnamed protein product [Paramecium tetraurelia]|eukprot:XP_001444509.1 hypothetical protein (macronuclear) [Paramecium tetraurelia strain d4-2]